MKMFPRYLATIAALTLLFLTNCLAAAAATDHHDGVVDNSPAAAAAVTTGGMRGGAERRLTNPDGDGATTDVCFSAMAQVQTALGTIPMSDLKVGDQVLTGSGTYQPVYAFGHKDSNRREEFLQIHTTTTSDKPLEVTESHLIFLEGKKIPIRADTLKVGDILQQAAGSGGKVVKVTTVQRDGIYGPWTPDGTIVVNGIVASSYASFQPNHKNEFVEFSGGVSTLSFQQFIHMTSSPFRVFCMGVSSNLCNIYTEEGIPLIVAQGGNFVLWVDQQSLWIQIVLFAICGGLTAASYLVEKVFGASAGPLVMFMMVGLVSLWGKKQQRNTNKKVKAA